MKQFLEENFLLLRAGVLSFEEKAETVSMRRKALQKAKARTEQKLDELASELASAKTEQKTELRQELASSSISVAEIEEKLEKLSERDGSEKLSSAKRTPDPAGFFKSIAKQFELHVPNVQRNELLSHAIIRFLQDSPEMAGSKSQARQLSQAAQAKV